MRSNGPENELHLSPKETPIDNLALAFIENIRKWQKAKRTGDFEKARVHLSAADNLANRLKEEFSVDPERYLDEVRWAIVAYDQASGKQSRF